MDHRTVHFHLSFRLGFSNIPLSSQNIVIFALAKKRLADYSSNTLGASYGPALWMHLAGAIVLL
jgi:hypothetical protein